MRSRLRALFLGLPTTRAGVEILLVVGFVGWRAVALAQLGLSLAAAWERTTSRPLFATTLAAFTVFSLTLAFVLARDRAYRRVWWAWADVAVGVTVLLAQHYFVPPDDVVGSWTAWGFALTVNTTFGAVIALSGWRRFAVASSGLAAAYLAVSVPAAHSPDVLSGVLSNSAGYLGLALLGGPVVAYLRRLGSQADESREAAAEAGRRAEADRHRLLLHDHATVLRLLSRPHLDPVLAELLRRQAAAGSHKVRSFLADHQVGGGSAGPGRALPDVLVAAAEGFEDLPIEMSTDLARAVVLGSEAAGAVERAVCTLLHNVRVHAEASSVVIHADAAERTWEVTVHDDGVGFDLPGTALSFGLRVQVVQALAAHAIRAQIESEPGEGTTVTISGPRGAEP